MVRNTNQDLNNHLFEMLERLNDEDLTEEQLDKEISRAKAMTDVSKSIIENSKLALDAAKLQAEYSGRVTVPKMLAYESQK
ncbi:hypothetical protein [Facklamia sp. P12955]|uniref:hypothetical protein n=1 Tax=Facklamia sp. P12955 TaxID=3421946 RepID=UPI003D179687